MEIVKFKPFESGALKGFFDVKLNNFYNLIIRGMKLFEQNGKRWVQFPSEKKENDEGKIEYFPMLKFEDRTVKENFEKQVLDNLKDFRKNEEKAESEGVPF